jgi:ABC-type sulfate transport system substrate-binding protein
VLTVKQSHGGSGKQARSVIDGLEADVVTLALAYDIDVLNKNGQADPGRLAEAPAAQQQPLHQHHRLPGAQGQPQGHQGLGRPRQARRLVVTPNPKTSGGARWNYLAAWGYAPRRSSATTRPRRREVRRRPAQERARAGQRRARLATTFVERGVGDVLLAWENEAFLALKELGPTSSRSSCPA